MAESIQNLRIYTNARELEDGVYEVVKGLPQELQYPLGNDLRRASGAVAHHLSDAHRRYSYSLKLESLGAARDAAELTQRLLGQIGSKVEGSENAKKLSRGYTGVIKQAWGLIKYLKSRRAERLARNEAKTEAKIKDEQVAARA